MIELQPSVSFLGAPVSETLPGSGTNRQPVVRPVLWTSSRYLAAALQGIKFWLPLIACELLCVAATTLFCAGALTVAGVTLSMSSVLALIAMQSVLIAITYQTFGLYQNLGGHPVQEIESAARAVGITVISTLIIGFVARASFGPGAIALAGISGFVILALLPSVRHLLRCCLGRTSWWRTPILVFSSAENAESIIDSIDNAGFLAWRPIGYVGDFHEHWNSFSSAKNCLGDEEDVPGIVEGNQVFWGLVDVSSIESHELQSTIDRYHRMIPNLVFVSGNKGQTILNARGIGCGGFSGVHYQSMLTPLSSRSLKRLSDLAIASAVLFFTWPVLLLVALGVRLSGPGPILYSQERIGRDGKVFRIWKFRTMVADADKVLKDYLANNPTMREEWRCNQKLLNDPRITKLGKYLRKASIDELPQLWNVFNGTMSLVGPRPIVRNEIEKYGDVYWLYSRARPGVTGLWQVSGRNHTTYDERLTYDSFYVRNWSIWLDWYILLRTVRVVLRCEGAY